MTNLPRILILSRYGRQGASSRLRTMQYEPYLAAAGLEATYAPFFNDEYLANLYSKRGQRLAFTRYFQNRRNQLAAAPRPDIIWLEKEAFPWVPWVLEHRLLPRGVPIIADYDDAVFHRYDGHRNPIVRRILGSKIDDVMRSSALVTAGNEYLADRAHAAGAKRVELVPTVVDMKAYASVSEGMPGTVAGGTSRPVIGWIGSPTTWTDYMVPLMPLLEGIAQAADADVHAVGADLGTSVPSRFQLFPWFEETEVDMIRQMTVGIMPLSDTPWSRGKCGYKLIQYMACGIPVVAAPVGVNSDIVRHGENGFLASTEDDWRTALRTLLSDPVLCRHMGQAGRHLVERKYTLQIQGPRVAELLGSMYRN
ncbi:glycosyltransferase family 4 protein [Fodinicurvata sp. EGI_FJ10296]|uniref:glycosyltransferase family 4 protein n=1 Tax=Fodinicurvata sp. EGI_FJ10296 TaxID=3231908 RepID=UPI0034546C62